MVASSRTVDGTFYAVVSLVVVAAVIISAVLWHAHTSQSVDSVKRNTPPSLKITGQRVSYIDASPLQKNIVNDKPAQTATKPQVTPIAASLSGSTGGKSSSPSSPTTPVTSPVVTPGKTVTATINANSVTDLSGAQIDLTYDSSILSLQSVSEGSFLDAGDSSAAMLLNTFTNAAGSVRNIILLRVAQPGVTGTGSLATVTFVAIGSGDPQLSIDQALLSDSQARNILNSLSVQTTIT